MRIETGLIKYETFIKFVSNENSSKRPANPKPSFAYDFEGYVVNSEDLDTPSGSKVDEEDLRKFPKI